MRHPCRTATIATPSCSRSGATLVGGSRGRLDALRGGPSRTCVSLPGYPFARQRHWVEPADHAGGRMMPRRPTAARRTGRRRRLEQPPERTNGQSPMEATLQRIWAQCLGVDSVDRNANFFELGGDSLVAISVAMTAVQRRPGPHAAGPVRQPDRCRAGDGPDRPLRGGRVWRAIPDGDVLNPPVPPNISYFLERRPARAAAAGAFR